ncbi:MAG TPA: RsmE family RNA methyltransferase, partial [Bacteroidales bacterium]|nr:RsmE family RNA methyltransferase [Bacteroidales bacterium]
MEYFYIEEPGQQILTMKTEESFHCIKVLRNSVGDKVNFTDGKGNSGKGVIIDDSPKSCRIEVIEQKHHEFDKPYQLHVAIAPTKNRDRFEWFVEKATEIGIDTIIPVICERSERKSIRTDRLENIAIAAMKQSKRFFKPDVLQVIPFDRYLEESIEGSKYIAHCIKEDKTSIKTLPKRNNYNFLIGPEGDFSEI